jgi:hypothetical protein
MEVTRLWKDPQLRRGLGLVLIGVLVALSQGSAGGAERQPTHGTLRVVWDQELPPYPSGPAMDVRWASDRTVYLAWVNEGITETALDGKFSRLRTLVPNPEQRFRSFDMLAVSPSYLVTSSQFRSLAFRPTARQESGYATITRLRIGIVEALDLSGTRLLMLGNPEGDQLSAEGVIARVGPLTDHPEKDLLPLQLHDVGGAGSPSLANCASLPLGGARFLPDGSFLVVPGFQPGAHLFSSGGRPLRTWDTQALGIDAINCLGISADQRHQFANSEASRFSFLNQHRVLEAILPLEEGPGLIVRWVAGGKVHWELKVLQSGARVLTYEVPFTGELPYARLRGDVANHRIVLLLREHGFDHVGPPFRPTHLFVAELPLGTQKGGQQQ